MTESRVKAKLWVQATVRACYAQGYCATVVRSGDDDAGTVLIKQNRMGLGFHVLTPIRTTEGERAWMRGTGAAPVAEPLADDYIARQIDRDYDIWVIEIEDRDGRVPFDERIV